MLRARFSRKDFDMCIPDSSPPPIGRARIDNVAHRVEPTDNAFGSNLVALSKPFRQAVQVVVARHNYRAFGVVAFIYQHVEHVHVPLAHLARADVVQKQHVAVDKLPDDLLLGRRVIGKRLSVESAFNLAEQHRHFAEINGLVPTKQNLRGDGRQ